MSFTGGQSNPELVTLTAKLAGSARTGFPIIAADGTMMTADSNTDVLIVSGSGVVAMPNTTTDTLTLTTTTDLRLSQTAVKEAANTWRHQPIGTTSSAFPIDALSSVLWVSELGLFVATANYAGVAYNNILTSPDGIHWTPRFTFTSAQNTGWDSVCWSPEKGFLLAVQSDVFAATERVMTSPDGITWTLNGNGANNRWVSVIWVKELGLFVAVAKSGGSGSLVQTSITGTTSWNTRTTTVSDLRCVAWSKELARLVALGHATSNEMQSSTNGTTWTAHALPGAGTIKRNAVAWSPELGLFVAVGEDVITSGNGTTWTLGSLPGGVTECFSVIWVPEFRAFVSVTNHATERFMISFDGFTWTTGTSPNAYAWRFLGWSPDLGILVTVGSGLELLSTGPGVMTSKRVGIWGSLENAATHDQVMSRLSLRI